MLKYYDADWITKSMSKDLVKLVKACKEKKLRISPHGESMEENSSPSEDGVEEE